MNGISQQMQLEFAAGVADLDDKPALILVCVRVGHGLLPAHPLLGKEHEQLRLRQLVSKAAIAPYRERPGLAWQRASPSLEDVFIDLMGRARDNFQ